MAVRLYFNADMEFTRQALDVTANDMYRYEELNAADDGSYESYEARTETPALQMIADNEVFGLGKIYHNLEENEYAGESDTLEEMFSILHDQLVGLNNVHLARSKTAVFLMNDLLQNGVGNFILRWS